MNNLTSERQYQSRMCISFKARALTMSQWSFCVTVTAVRQILLGECEDTDAYASIMVVAFTKTQLM